jgi:hypothetical protein
MFCTVSFRACMLVFLVTALPSEAGESESPSSGINACSLLDAETIAKVVGLPVEPGIRTDAGIENSGAYSSTCLWVIRFGGSEVQDPAAPLGGRSFAILNVLTWKSGSGLAGSFLDAFNDAAKNGWIPKVPQVRAFGDRALWWGDGLAVASADVSFGLSVYAPALETAYSGEFEESLAPEILRHLAEPNK